MWRTTFDPKLIPKEKASLKEGIIDDNPADPHTLKYELRLIDLFQNTSDLLIDEGKGFGLAFATTRRLVVTKLALIIHPVWFIPDTSNFRLVCPLEFPSMVHTTSLI